MPSNLGVGENGLHPHRLRLEKKHWPEAQVPTHLKQPGSSKPAKMLLRVLGNYLYFLLIIILRKNKNNDSYLGSKFTIESSGNNAPKQDFSNLRCRPPGHSGPSSRI